MENVVENKTPQELGGDKMTSEHPPTDSREVSEKKGSIGECWRERVASRDKEVSTFSY